MTAAPHGLVLAYACKIFEDLQVAATLYFVDGTPGLRMALAWEGAPWVQVHAMPNVLDFEVEHGVISERHVYNARCLERVRHTQRTVLGSHAGFYDLFVPLSELFHQKEGTTFASYVTRLRIERAQELLVRTPLNLQRVAQLSGFSSADYLSRVFKRATSETPIGYRWRARHLKRPRGAPDGGRSSRNNRKKRQSRRTRIV